MNAVVLVSNGVLERRALPASALQPDECRIAVRAAGVCSSDVPRAFQSGAYHYPLVMGHELAGEVLECGSQAALDFGVGDHVGVFPLIPCRQCDACAAQEYARCRSYDYYGSRRHGGFAEELTVRSWNLLPLPPDMPFADAALIEPVAVVYHALRRGRAIDADLSVRSIAILGAGFLGLVAAELLRIVRPDAAVTVIDRNAFKLDLAAQSGATPVSVAGDDGWERCLQDHRDRFDLTLEASGAPRMFVAATELARGGGAVVWMGNISGDLSIPQKLVSAILRKELTVIGTWNSSYRGREQSEWTRVRDLIAGGFRPSRFVSHAVELDGLPDALARLNEHRTGAVRHAMLKVLVRMDGRRDADEAR